MRVRRSAAVAVLVLGWLAASLPARAATTELVYSIKDARAFLTQLAYPQGTFVSEFYGPCNPDTDPFGCDRGRYDQTPGSCEDAALGRTEEAPESPTREELDGADPPKIEPPEFVFAEGNPVTVTHGMAQGRISSTPESGGLASMYYVDNSGRRETRAHAESDGFVGNRSSYEERCGVVDAVSESDYPGALKAHVLSRADDTPSTYNMAAFTTAEAPTPPGSNKESVAIVKLFVQGGRLHGLLTSTVRGATLMGGAVTVDVVRSVISFSSDGTKEGLEVAAATTAAGVTVNGMKIGSLPQGAILAFGENSLVGVLAPVVQLDEAGTRFTVRAPGLFVAATTGLDALPIPEDPFGGQPALRDLRFQMCDRFAQDQARFPCRMTLGGSLKSEQVVYVAGALVDAFAGRGPVFELPRFVPPKLPPPPPLPPLPRPPAIAPPPPPAVAPSSRPVALPTFDVRAFGGSPWPLASIVALSALGLLAVGARWSMRFGWARTLSRTPPFPAVGWAYRMFLKD